MASRSVRDQIVDDLVSAMGLPDGAGVYHYAMQGVFRWKTPAPSMLDFPSAVVVDLDERVEVLNYALDERTLSVTVQAIGHAGAFEGTSNAEADDVARKILADVQVAAQIDTTRGGVAIRTHEVANRIFVDAPAEPFVVVEVDFEVLYRTKRGDPTVAHA